MRSKKLLIWLPVALLPLSNLIVALVTRTPLTVSLTWILGAVAEELFFRWLLLRQILLPRMKPVFAIVLVSVIFATMHLLNLLNGTPLLIILPQMFCAFCFSIWAGAVVWNKDWIWVPLLAHVLLNATAVVGNNWVSLFVGLVVLADGILLIIIEGKRVCNTTIHC